MKRGGRLIYQRITSVAGVGTLVEEPPSTGCPGVFGPVPRPVSMSVMGAEATGSWAARQVWRAKPRSPAGEIRRATPGEKRRAFLDPGRRTHYGRPLLHRDRLRDGPFEAGATGARACTRLPSGANSCGRRTRDPRDEGRTRTGRSATPELASRTTNASRDGETGERRAARRPKGHRRNAGGVEPGADGRDRFPLPGALRTRRT